VHTKYFTAAALVLAVSFIACNKGEDEPALAGGKGGNATLHVDARHHTRAIDSCMIYIKYKAKDVPAFYDDSMKVSGAAGLTTASFTGLTKGNYYLFAKGWDPSISHEVMGGLPFEIKEEMAYTVTVPVTEGD
jgi:hypothetical protein